MDFQNLNPKKILLIKVRPLVDTLEFRQGIQLVSDAFPKAKVDVLIQEGMDSFVSDLPFTKLLTFNRNLSAPIRAKQMISLSIVLGKTKYDLCLNFHASPSTSKLALASLAPIRAVHSYTKFSKDRYSTLVIPSKNEDHSNHQKDLDTLGAIGIHSHPRRIPIKKRKGLWIDSLFNEKSDLLVVSTDEHSKNQDSIFEKTKIWIEEKKGNVLFLKRTTKKVPILFQELPSWSFKIVDAKDSRTLIESLSEAKEVYTDHEEVSTLFSYIDQNSET